MSAVSKRNPDTSDLCAAATREERAANARSIHRIPRGEFPDVAARAELIWRALRGEDVYAYRPASSTTHVVWMRQPDPALEARFAPMEWAARWRAAGMPSSARCEGEGNEEKGGAA